MTTDGNPGALGSNDQLGMEVNRALSDPACQRLNEWALIGPVQRAEIQSFAERLLAAERERLRVMLTAHLDQTVASHHVTIAECHAARNALQLVLDQWA